VWSRRDIRRQGGRRDSREQRRLGE
jgi:hypothetical protein